MFLAAILLVSNTVAATAEDALPWGFRFPTDLDRTGGWHPSVCDVPDPFHVVADFNGDGLLDQAWILIRTTGKGCGLFIFGARIFREPTRIEMREAFDTDAQLNRIAIAEPGDYEALCDQGQHWCGPDLEELCEHPIQKCRPYEVGAIVTLPHSGIELLQFGKPRSIVWLSRETGFFTESRVKPGPGLTCPDDQIVTERGCIDRPKLLSKTDPKYPEKARRRGLEARVTLTAIVGPDGTLSQVQVVKCTVSGVGFEDAAMKAVEKWRYEPVVLAGEPLSFQITVVVDFILTRGEA